MQKPSALLSRCKLCLHASAQNNLPTYSLVGTDVCEGVIHFCPYGDMSSSSMKVRATAAIAICLSGYA